MAPASRRGKASNPRRTKCTKKKPVKTSNININQINTTQVVADLTSRMDDGFDHYNERVDDISTTTTTTTTTTSTSPCSTPKAQRFRIPETGICPPAPKKQRSVVSNCSLQRSPIPFFASPDLELFFFFAFRNISV